MGGKVGSGTPLGDLARLQEEARQSIRREIKPGKQNVFISFVVEDEREVNALRGQAKNEDSDIEFNDWSVRIPYDSERAEYIKAKIRERIRLCSVTVVYLSERTAKSAWVDWEIRESARLGKGIIALHAGDMPPKQISPALVELGIKPIAWTAKGISKAIRNAAPAEKK